MNQVHAEGKNKDEILAHETVKQDERLRKAMRMLIQYFLENCAPNKKCSAPDTGSEKEAGAGRRENCIGFR